MWKSLLCVSLLVGYSSAGVASWSEDVSVHDNLAVTGIHYSQHESSVNAARKAAADRLSQQQAAALVASGSSAAPCDTICYNSFTAGDAGDAETIGQGIVGFAPGAGSASGSSQKYSSSSSRQESSSVQQNVHGAASPVYPVVASIGATGGRSSFSSSSSSRQHSSSSLNGGASGGVQPVSAQLYSSGADQGRVQTGSYYAVAAPQTHASQSSFNERSSQERSSVVSRPVVANVVYTAVPVGGASHSSNNYNTRASFVASSDQQQHVQPVAYSPTSNSDYSRRYSTQQDHQYRQYPASNTYVVYTKPIAAQPVQYYAPSQSRVEEAGSSSSNAYDSSGRVVNLNVVQPVTHSERVDEQRTQQRVDSVQSVQRQADLYPVRGSFDQHQHHDHDTHDYHEDQVDGNVRTGSQYVPSAGSTGSTNRYSASEAQRSHTYHSAPTYVVAPVVPVAGSVSASKYESASEQQQQRHSSHNALNSGSTYVPVVVQPVPVGGSSTASRYAASSAQQEQRTHVGGAAPVSTYYTQPGSGGYGSQFSNSALHASNSRYKANNVGAGGRIAHYPITNDEMGRQFGATGASRGYGADTDLRDIMSESESLARLQAQNVHNGAVTGSATIDVDSRFGGGAPEGDGLGTMPGGFQRTKSWSSSSKWASEQRYGDDGKPKTYSMLSTAESEKHNINGKTTGYKAATTTLEDDGKVSTYSLHTT